MPVESRTQLIVMPGLARLEGRLVGLELVGFERGIDGEIAGHGRNGAARAMLNSVESVLMRRM